MTPNEWAIQAFDACDHAGMICMRCAEEAIRAAIEEDRTRRLADQGLPSEGLPDGFTSPLQGAVTGC